MKLSPFAFLFLSAVSHVSVTLMDGTTLIGCYLTTGGSNQAVVPQNMVVYSVTVL